MRPLISIITPTYNHEKYISECIESVLEQTYHNWEMIIVDDCSKDKTIEIIESYLQKYPDKIKLIRHKENYGPLYLDKTYNEALKLSRGEWIAILEGDDVWTKYKLERQVEYLSRYKGENIVLIHGKAGLIKEEFSIVNYSSFGWPLKEKLPEDKPYDALKFLFYGINPVFALTTLIRKETLLEIGGFIQDPREIKLVDFPTWLRLATKGKFLYIPELLGFWRRHSSSITMNYYEDTCSNFISAIKNFVKNFNVNFNLSQDIIGIMAYLPLIFSYLINGEFDNAERYYKRIKKSLKVINLNQSTMLKLFLVSILIKVKSKKLVRFLWKLKNRKIDEKICDYKPCFFKEI